MFQIQEIDLYCPKCNYGLSPIEVDNFCDKCGLNLSPEYQFRLEMQYECQTLKTREKWQRIKSVIQNELFLINALELLPSERHEKEHVQILTRTIVINFAEFMTGDKTSFEKCSKFCTICGEKLPAFSKIPKTHQNLLLGKIEDYMRRSKYRSHFRYRVIKTIQGIGE